MNGTAGQETSLTDTGYVEMSIKRFFRGGITILTCCGMLSAQLAQAAGPQTTIPATRESTAALPAIRDVALAESGIFRGQVVDQQGVGTADLPLVVVRDGQEVARSQTNATGQFEFRGLNGGIYELHTPVGGGVYRLWAPRTAPPAAESSVIIVPDELVVRGQFYRGGRALGWLANPWVLAAIVAAAIAIPLALDDDDAS